MIRAIALDDEPLALKIISFYCNQIEFVSLEKTFTKPTEALKHLNKFPVDLLFLDIQMPSKNGIDFYKSIEQKTKVIFTTAHSEFAVEGFNLEAVDYLLKPFSFERFLQAVEKAKKSIDSQNNTDKYLFIRADYSLHKILFSEILYIESLDDYLKIHIENQKTITARMTLKVILEKLPSLEFARVHRSYIVAVKRINKIRNKTIFINEKEIPISSSYEESFNKIIPKI